MSELEPRRFERMLKLKQDDWLEACGEIDELKKKLEEANESYEKCFSAFLVKNQKLEEYEKSVGQLHLDNIFYKSEMLRNDKKLAIAKEALEFYANGQNYSGGYYDTVSNEAEDKAKDALEKLSE